MKIAFFDFDGTLTNKDSFLKFIIFSFGTIKFLYGMLILSPILLGYKVGFVKNYKAKEIIFSWYFKDMSQEIFLRLTREYSLSCIQNILRKKALDRIAWHKSQNHKIVIVSASIDCWLRPWSEKEGFDLIATKIEIQNEKLTGKMSTKNCHGQEKVNRIKDSYDLSSYDYIYSYGDSIGDKQMLEIAHEKYYKPFQ